MRATGEQMRGAVGALAICPNCGRDLEPRQSAKIRDTSYAVGGDCAACGITWWAIGWQDLPESLRVEAVPLGADVPEE